MYEKQNKKSNPAPIHLKLLDGRTFNVEIGDKSPVEKIVTELLFEESIVPRKFTEHLSMIKSIGTTGLRGYEIMDKVYPELESLLIDDFLWATDGLLLRECDTSEFIIYTIRDEVLYAIFITEMLNKELEGQDGGKCIYQAEDNFEITFSDLRTLETNAVGKEEYEIAASIRDLISLITKKPLFSN